MRTQISVKAYNARRAERDQLKKALKGLLEQLEGIGIYIPGEDSGQWHGTEGLSFAEAEKAVHQGD